MRRPLRYLVCAALLGAGLTSCNVPPRNTTGAAAAQGTPTAAPGGTVGTGAAALRTGPSDSPVATGAGGGTSGGATAEASKGSGASSTP